MHGICDYDGLGCHSVTTGSPAARMTVVKRRAGSKMPCVLTAADFVALLEAGAAYYHPEVQQEEADDEGEPESHTEL
jgi:hypothetical protein